MRLIDEQCTACPFYGSRPMTVWLTQTGEVVNRKRVQRLMRVMGLEAIYPKPRLSAAGRGHRIYPYLLRDVRVERPHQALGYRTPAAVYGTSGPHELDERAAKGRRILVETGCEWCPTRIADDQNLSRSGGRG